MIEFCSTMYVSLVDNMGDDELICRAARVSTLGSESIDSTESQGLINYLLKNRHGSPFEHGAMTFLIEAPIMVWREFMRHRIGFSYNEESGRYKELSPRFYLPSSDRNLQQVGKPGHYDFVPGTREQYSIMENAMSNSYKEAWFDYQGMLRAGIAREVARMVLPVAIYSSAYVTCNPRSLMSFLSLRTKHEQSTFKSFPQAEINMVASQMESTFSELYPLTYKAFHENGRVAP